MPISQQTYLNLPPELYQLQEPQPVSDPKMVIWNHSLGEEWGLGEDVALFAGNAVPASLTPLAQAYAGHQFGHFTMLGDGRAVLLGEAEKGGGERVDVQLKGSGRTRYSRGGDGRAALEPMLREYLISEAMHALGIPTTRSLCVVSTGEKVYREEVLPGAILTRLASSHLRVGTFEFAAGFRPPEELSALLRYAMDRHDPACETGADFFQGVIDRQASLVAKWMAVGFVHGVMNTDNVAISGETIDYGPCAFMDRYDPETVFSSIDQQGRYAYGNQPQITHWNLAVLASALLPLFDEEEEAAEAIARECLDRFPQIFRAVWQKEMNEKLGLSSLQVGDDQLVGDLLNRMHEGQMDYTNTFRDLHPEHPLTGLEDWHQEWVKRLAGEEGVMGRMQAHNPAVIPRNQQVEAALHAAGEGEMSHFHSLLDLLKDPYNRKQDFGELAVTPPKDAPAYKTFCGT
ncbi:YdiU family protein [Kiritimatiellaeota bacterium B1221]|nr:YdiU family protein [Kiritimatiellaeota bacterium B1221]